MKKLKIRATGVLKKLLLTYKALLLSLERRRYGVEKWHTPEN